MKHVDTIQKLVRTLLASDKIHGLVVVSPPGWAKSTTVDEALSSSGAEHHAIGSYTTPLALYNALCAHPTKLILLDDCAGVFNDMKAMAVLKAATWSSAGISGARRVTWDSTSERVDQPEVQFKGKLVLLANVLPSRKEVQAFLSRTLHYRISFTADEAKGHLLQAARVERYFPKTKLAVEVAEFLVNELFDSCPADEISLRTLHVGYEVAESNPREWRELLTSLLVTQDRPKDPVDLIRELAEADQPVRAQLERFQEATGMSRRTFFNYRRQLGVGAE